MERTKEDYLKFKEIFADWRTSPIFSADAYVEAEIKALSEPKKEPVKRYVCISVAWPFHCNWEIGDISDLSEGSKCAPTPELFPFHFELIKEDEVTLKPNGAWSAMLEGIKLAAAAGDRAHFDRKTWEANWQEKAASFANPNMITPREIIDELFSFNWGNECDKFSDLIELIGGETPVSYKRIYDDIFGLNWGNQGPKFSNLVIRIHEAIV